MWLPDASALSASMRGEPRGWGAERHLLTTVVDAVQANTYVTAKVAGGKPKKPKPIPRPKSKTKKTTARVVRVADLVRR